MKQSLYTICCWLGNGEYALYNTANGHFAVCDEAVANAFRQGAGPVEPGSEQPPQGFPAAEASLSPEVLEQLAAAGFVVPNDANELATQQQLFCACAEKKDQLWLAIAPTYACNCRCAYCY